MLKQRFLLIATLFATLFLSVGCSPDSGENGASQEDGYGVLQFGEEQIPINFVQSYHNEDILLVILSPLRIDAR